SSASPPALRGAALAYHAALGRTVLFGGSRDSAGLETSQLTYEWDGRTWQNASAGGSPPPRLEHAMAYHADRGYVVLFGCPGRGAAGGAGARYGVVLRDTW